MDVEVIIKRTVVYAAAITAIATIYAVLLKLAGRVFVDAGGQSHTIMAVLATLVVVLLAPLVKNTIQTLLDRAYYRDRYDYRRALVAFARELNTDLDLQRLSERLVDRVVDTLILDRMCLLLTPVADETPQPLRGGALGRLPAPAAAARRRLGHRQPRPQRPDRQPRRAVHDAALHRRGSRATGSSSASIASSRASPRRGRSR